MNLVLQKISAIYICSMWFISNDAIIDFALSFTQDQHQRSWVHQRDDPRDDLLVEDEDSRFTGCWWLTPTCKHVIDVAMPRICTCGKNMTRRYIIIHLRGRRVFHVLAICRINVRRKAPESCTDWPIDKVWRSIKRNLTCERLTFMFSVVCMHPETCNWNF